MPSPDWDPSTLNTHVLPQQSKGEVGLSWITRSGDALSHPMSAEAFGNPRRLISQGNEPGILTHLPSFPPPGGPFSPAAEDTNILLDNL